MASSTYVRSVSSSGSNVAGGGRSFAPSTKPSLSQVLKSASDFVSSVVSSAKDKVASLSKSVSSATQSLSGTSSVGRPLLVAEKSSASAVPVVSNSAGSVAAGTVPANNQFGDISSILQQVMGVSEANTARSEQMARDQMDFQRQQNQLAMDFNSAEAAKNRDWQEMMSNTAHQREVADLRAAGLNPVLSATGGNGAAVTSGATASGVTSAGAKGEVDTAYAQSLVSLMAVMLQTAAQVEAASVSAGAVVRAAEASAGAARYAADRSYGQQEYRYQNLDRNELVRAFSSLVGSAVRTAIR